MIRISICDDEDVICDMLRQQVSSHMDDLKKPYEIKCYTNAAQLMQSPLHYDILLLDIQMPELDGLTFAKKLRENEMDCALIFITALEEHVFDAFEVEAIDYICKPIDDKRLKKALERALKKAEASDDKYLLIKTMNWCKSIKISSIYYCEIINRKIYLHTQNSVIDYYCKIEDVEKQLDYRFVRSHRSYLVNLDYLIEYANGQITLENGALVPVSRLRHQELMEAMMQYMKKKEV